MDILPGAVLDGFYGVADFLGGVHGFFRQLAHFIGDNGEAFARFTGSCGFNGRV